MKLNKKLIVPSLVIVAVLAAVWLYDIPEIEYQIIHGETQGTSYNITYQSSQNLQEDIDALLHQFDLSLSTYEPASIISRINRNESDVQLDTWFTEVFNESKRIYELTDGTFDITVAPIVNALGFGYTAAAVVDSLLIDSLLHFVGMEKVQIRSGQLVKEIPEVLLDVNAIAQGYSVDVVAKFLDEKNIKNYLVEIGGELKCKGLNPKSSNWKIGIDRPVEGNMVPGENMQAVVTVKGKSLATSGNYRKFYEKDGVKYAHSIDPKTGYPVLSRLLSTTIITDECVTADAIATACMVMGLEKSKAFLESQSEVEAYLIYNDEEGRFNIYATKGMKDYILDERTD